MQLLLGSLGTPVLEKPAFMGDLGLPGGHRAREQRASAPAASPH